MKHKLLNGYKYKSYINSLLQKCRERPNVVRPFPGRYASGSYVHHTAL
jgi:hypothetical protein